MPRGAEGGRKRLAGRERSAGGGPPWSPLLAAAAIGAFGAGAAILLLAEAEWLRVLGAIGLLAGIACGTWLIADPRELARDEDE